MVLAQSGTSRASTRGAQRYSSGSRSKASVSASTRPRPVRRAASSYHARACPISVWAIDEKATSSSRKGAIPVHSELRQPRISSSSASASSSCAFTRLLQLDLQRVAVHAAVVAIEHVGHVRIENLLDGLTRDDPESERLVAATVELARVRLCEREVRSLERAAVLERLPLTLLAENLVNHAACGRTAFRTQAVSSRDQRRKPSRSSVFGPWPVTTCLSSSQSGSEYSQTPSSSRLRSLGSGTVSPSSQICGT